MTSAQNAPAGKKKGRYFACEIDAWAVDSKTVNRFLEKVIRGDPDQCWSWSGYVDNRGYGSFSFNCSRTAAHRFAFFVEHGYLPKHVLHRCNNKTCTNPAHLAPGDARLNVVHAIHDGLVRKRKLCADDVIEIRALKAAGAATKAIASRFGVHKTLIGKIIAGTRWWHVGTDILDGILMRPPQAIAA